MAAERMPGRSVPTPAGEHRASASTIARSPSRSLSFSTSNRSQHAFAIRVLASLGIEPDPTAPEAFLSLARKPPAVRDEDASPAVREIRLFPSEARRAPARLAAESPMSAIGRIPSESALFASGGFGSIEDIRNVCTRTHDPLVFRRSIGGGA